MADTMLSFSNNNLGTYMTKDQLRSVCPMAFKGITNPNVSDRYVHASTEMVVDDLAKLGWYPVQAKQCRTNKNSSGIRSFHMIAFQNEDVKIVKQDTESGDEYTECYPRIILTNSHDGFTSFRFMVGLFRLVCSNGLVIATDQMADVRIRHINYSFEELRAVVRTSIENVPIQVACMNNMEKTILTDEQKTAIAVNALKIRQGKELEDNVSFDKDTIDEILTPIRNEDKGNNLWNVFNVIQEHIIKGDFSLMSEKSHKLRKQRRITSVSKDLSINSRLFQMANSYALAA